MDLTNVTHFIGIDISKNTLDCWLRPDGKHLQCDNSEAGFQRIDTWLTDHGCTHQSSVICMEDTGIYGKRLLVSLTQMGWTCSVEKTTILEKVGPDHHRKEDDFDAELLAEYADRFSDQLSIQTPADPVLDQLQQLYSERRRLVRQRTATKTKQSQSSQQPDCPQLLKQGWGEQLRLFEEHIERLDQQIQQCIQTHEGLTYYYQLLRSIPGIGQVSAWIWLIMFYGQQKLNPKSIASRFGVAPHAHQSGTSVRGKTRSSGHGSSEIRSTLTMAAQSASTHHDKFVTYKQRKLEEGKPWPVVRNNLVNKLITIICAIWNTQTRYEADHESRFERQKKAA